MRPDDNEDRFTLPEEGGIHPDTPWYHTPFFGRLLAVAFPPLGLLLFRTNRFLKPRPRRIATILLTLYLFPYTLGVIYLLILTDKADIEWRGGFGPSLVRRKTAPNYLELEGDRAAQQTPSAEAGTNSPSAPQTPYWTDFRGPMRDGHYTEQPVVTNWPAQGPPLRWRQPCGGGYASFAVGEGQAFTIEQRRDDEAVVAYDLETGRELWSHRYPAHFDEWMGGDGPRATPSYHQGLVYSMGATGEFCCLGASNGRVLWQENVLTNNGSANLRYGMATSPLVLDEKVIVLTGQATKGKSVVAYHRLTGEHLWSALDDKQAYTSPLLATLGGHRQLLVVSATRVVGLKPENGALLWEYPWRVQYDNAICTPLIVSSNRFLISAGYGTGCALVEIVSTNASGLVAREVWRNRNLRNKFNASVVWQGYAYGLDEGVLCCLDVEKGERRWRQGDYGYGQLLLASGHLLILSGRGELAWVRADPERRIELARVPALNGKTWNVPALAHGLLLVRNGVEMACYDLRLPAATTAP